MSLETCRGNVKSLLDGKSAASFKTEADWKRVEDTVRRWFAFVKTAESDDTFDKAFLDSRMTMRGIKWDRQDGHYTESVPLRGPHEKADMRQIRTMQGVAGVKARVTSSNFGFGAKIARVKYKEGLFDVSAVLLNPKLSLRIGGGPIVQPPAQVAGPARGGPPPPPPPPKGDDTQNQIYRLTGDTTYVFMPIPDQGDMEVCYLLTEEAKKSASQGFKQFVMYMKSRFTRIKFVFEGDAGATFIDFAPAGDIPPRFKYGFGNLLPTTASDEEIKQRRLSATRYKQILKSGKRNEIIIAYRQHGELARQPSTFPLFAKGVFKAIPARPSEPVHKGYLVVDERMQSKGHIITLAGEMKPGDEHTLDGSVRDFPPA